MHPRLDDDKPYNNRITMDEKPYTANDNLPQIYKTSGGKEEKIYRTLEEKIADCFMVPGPGRVIILPDEFVYHGRLIIPKSAERAGTTGTVLKVGEGCTAPFSLNGTIRTIQPGDRVAYGTWTGTQFSFDQRPSYRVLAETDIASVITDKATKLLEVEA